MSQQPEALTLRLADAIDYRRDWYDFDPSAWCPQAAAELRRLHAVELEATTLRAQVERLQAAHIDVPEGWRLVMVEAGTAPDEPDWDEVMRQAETTTGLKVERNTYSIVIREVRRWLTQRATPQPEPAPVAPALEDLVVAHSITLYPPGARGYDHPWSAHTQIPEPDGEGFTGAYGEGDSPMAAALDAINGLTVGGSNGGGDK